jgi:predicted alpha/beta-fold hydrolase
MRKNSRAGGQRGRPAGRPHELLTRCERYESSALTAPMSNAAADWRYDSRMTTVPPYRPAWFVPGRHLRTLWGKLIRRRPRVPTTVERWTTPDDDVLFIHRLQGSPDRPLLVLLHGLEGSPNSHYARGMLARARDLGWSAAALVFRTCGGEMNQTRRFYHSGETSDLDFVMRRLTSELPHTPIVLAGFSLGGNVLLKWLGERGTDVRRCVSPLRPRARITLHQPRVRTPV